LITAAITATDNRRPVGTGRDWEQGRFAPPGSALLVARLAVEHPEVLRPYADVG
jgi:putative transcriptional regulator